MWHALPGGWRLLQGRLALLLLAPLRTRRLHIAPGTTGKAHEPAAVHLHPQTTLAVGAVKGAQGAECLAAFASERWACRQPGRLRLASCVHGACPGNTYTLPSSHLSLGWAESSVSMNGVRAFPRIGREVTRLL